MRYGVNLGPTWVDPGSGGGSELDLWSTRGRHLSHTQALHGAARRRVALPTRRLPEREQCGEPLPHPVGAQAHEPLQEQEGADPPLRARHGVRVRLQQGARGPEHRRRHVVGHAEVAVEELASQCHGGGTVTAVLSDPDLTEVG